MRRAQALAARRAAAAERLSRGDLPKGGAWIMAARENALERLHRMGLPARRDEYWRFTRPDTLIAAQAAPVPLMVDEDAPQFGELDRLNLVFVDGVLNVAQSDALAMENVEITTLEQAATQDIHWARELFGVLEAQGQAPVERPLAALNTATATQGLLIRVTGRAPRPISLTYLRSDEAGDGVVHHVIRLEKGAELTLLESGPAAARLSQVIEVDVADGARFNHIRTQGRDHGRRALTHLFARIGAEASFKSFSLTVNGALTRNEYVITLEGDESHATVSGAVAGDGNDGAFHQDDTVFITHAGARCESRQVFKKVLRNGATGVFQGKILVRQGAQKTDGYQISQALLLDEDSQFLAKPELEIHADDVACSHGATVGAIDEDALFYMISRGVPRRQAQDMLVLAFLSEALDEIDDEAIRDDIRSRLELWVERHSR